MAYIVKGTNLKSEQAYRIRLTAILDVIRYLLGQGLAFRGHDESFTSLRKGNFLELVHWYRLRNEEVGNVVLKNIDNELILNRFQNMDSRRNQLSRSTKHSVA